MAMLSAYPWELVLFVATPILATFWARYMMGRAARVPDLSRRNLLTALILALPLAVIATLTVGGVLYLIYFSA